MKNIFNLTELEQRVVIVIVMALLVATIAKHYHDAALDTPPLTPAGSPLSAAPPKNEAETDNSPP
jgi:hypothetical protein